jgi:hypothetical protein
MDDILTFILVLYGAGASLGYIYTGCRNWLDWSDCYDNTFYIGERPENFFQFFVDMIKSLM